MYQKFVYRTLYVMLSSRALHSKISRRLTSSWTDVVLLSITQYAYILLNQFLLVRVGETSAYKHMRHSPVVRWSDAESLGLKIG